MSTAIESIKEPFLELENIQILENQALTDKGDVTHIINTMLFLTKQFLKEEKSYWEQETI